MTRFHRHVMNYIGENVIDHINSNTLDNRHVNLRIVTTAQNAQNKTCRIGCASKYIGVSKMLKKWQATISVDGEFVSKRKALHREFQEANWLKGKTLLAF